MVSKLAAFTLLPFAARARALLRPLEREGEVTQTIVLGARRRFTNAGAFRDAWDREVEGSGLSYDALIALGARGAFSHRSRELLSPTRLRISRTWARRRDYEAWKNSAECRALDAFFESHPEFFHVSETVV